MYATSTTSAEQARKDKYGVIALRRPTAFHAILLGALVMGSLVFAVPAGAGHYTQAQTNPAYDLLDMFDGATALPGQLLLITSQLGKALTSYDSAEATAYRWQALANFYLKHGGLAFGSQMPKPLTAYDAAEASALRWQAIGNYYYRHRGLARIR